MMYTVAPFFTDSAETEHPWGEPFMIGADDVGAFRASARELVERMLIVGQPDGGHPLGMRIVGADGEVVFTYVRPAPSEA